VPPTEGPDAANIRQSIVKDGDECSEEKQLPGTDGQSVQDDEEKSGKQHIEKETT
jgi:hypothetical protein